MPGASSGSSSGGIMESTQQQHRRHPYDDLPNADGDDDDETSWHADVFSKLDAVLFLVDAGDAMRRKNFSGEVPLKQSLHVIVDMLKYKVVHSPNDSVGIVFFACAGSKNASSFPHIHVYRALQPPDAHTIVSLTRIIDPRSSQHFHELLAQLDSSTSTSTSTSNTSERVKGVQMYQCFWTCSQLFTNLGNADRTLRRIFVLTNNDAPESGAADTTPVASARKRAEALEQRGCIIEVVPLTSDAPNAAFDFTRFYAKVLSFDADVDADMSAATGASISSGLDALRQRLRCKSSAKRALARCRMDVGGGLMLAVRVYIAAMPTKRPKPARIDRSTHDVLTSTNSAFAATSGAVLHAHNVDTYLEYAGEHVPLSRADLAAVKRVLPLTSPPPPLHTTTTTATATAAVRLMGFKRVACLRPYHNVRAAYFLRPDDAQVRGSATVLLALIHAMHRTGRFALARIAFRAAAIPRFAALLPQLERKAADGRVEVAAGLNCVVLPFAEDIRECKMAESQARVDVCESLVDAASDVVSALQFPPSFSVQSFPNPSLDKFYAALQALALDEVDVRPTVDELVYHKREDESALDRFAKLAFGENSQEFFADTPKPAAVKRSSASLAGRNDGNIDFIGLYHDNELNLLRVTELRQYCAEHQLVKSGRKADLVLRVEQHIRDSLDSKP